MYLPILVVVFDPAFHAYRMKYFVSYVFGRSVSVLHTRHITFSMSRNFYRKTYLNIFQCCKFEKNTI